MQQPLLDILRHGGMLGFPGHGPFQLGIGRPQLIFVGPVVSPKSIGRCSILDVLEHVEMCT